MENKEIIIGRNPVLEYLGTLSSPSGAMLHVSKTAHGKIITSIIQEARRRGVRVELCENEDLSRFHSASVHQGVVLLVPSRGPRESDKEFLETVAGKKGVLVLLDQITDPHNVGSIIRSTEALGGDGVVLPRSHSAGVNPTVVKTSAGATAHLKILTVPNIARFLEEAKKAGYWIVGASQEGDGDMAKLRTLRPAVLIIGSEGSGMRRLTEEKCDFIARIPLRGNISSLNASVAAGIILYEILKA